MFITYGTRVMVSKHNKTKLLDLHCLPRIHECQLKRLMLIVISHATFLKMFSCLLLIIYCCLNGCDLYPG